MLSKTQSRFINAAGFEATAQTVQGRCSMCHAAEPVWDGLIVPPKGVVLETHRDIAANAREIYLQSGRSHAMPPGNLTGITAQERQMIVEWYENALRTQAEN